MDELRDIQHNWDELGLELGLKQSQLDATDSDKRTTDQKRRDVIMKWFKNSVPPCWEDVVRALKKMNENNLANKIAQRYGINYEQVHV